MTLHKKLLRDLWEQKGANLATIIVIAIGILIFNGAGKTLDDMDHSKKVFFQQANMPDAYVDVVSAPLNYANKLDKIKGIKTVEARRTDDVELYQMKKTLRLISITQSLSKYQILEGREPAEQAFEIILGNKFAEANHYKVGDKIKIVVSGQVQELTVSAIGRSAENIYIVKDQNSLFADPEEFGVAFIKPEILQAISGKKSYSQIIIAFERGFSYQDLKEEIENGLESFGVITSYAKKDQFSNLTVTNEIKELETTMVFMPLIFLLVAALVMSIMIKRIIDQQRGQIGILKAFGYSDWQVAWHYASYCVLLGILGGLLGSVLGGWFSDKFTELYKTYFNMAFISLYGQEHYYLRGIVLAVGFCTVSGLFSSRKALYIQPAEAMRPEAPASGRRSFIESFRLFNCIFNSKGVMAVRNIVRTRKRSFFIIIGLALAFAISIMPWSMLFMMEDMIFSRYENIEKYDAKVITNGLKSKAEVVNEIKHKAGVKAVEASISVPSKLNHLGLEEDVQLIGLEQDSKLYTIITDGGQRLNIDSSGIVLSRNIAKKMNLKVGSKLSFKSPYSRDKDKEVSIKVLAIVDQSIGSNGYLNIDYLAQLLGYHQLLNNLLLSTESEAVITELSEEYEDSKAVDLVQSKRAVIEQTKKRMDAAYSSMYAMAAVSMVMSFAIVYNIYLVVILERKREFATLMVLGMKEKEILEIVALEQWLSTFIAILIGTPLAKLMVVYLSDSLSNDLYTMPNNIKFPAIVIAAVLMIVSIFIAQILAASKIKQIDIVESLKAAE